MTRPLMLITLFLFAGWAFGEGDHAHHQHDHDHSQPSSSIEQSEDLQAQPSLSQQTVVVSIHPIALLVKSAWPALTVKTLVPINQSPHDFSMKPSHRVMVENADLIIWLGAELEPYLEKVLSSRHNHVALVQEADHHHDPHVWLAPQELEAMLQHIQSVLKLPQPTAFLQAYQQWLLSAKQRLQPYQDRGFVAYHDAFHHWVDYFQLTQLAEVAIDPEKPVGSRHLLNVRDILASGGAHCVFVEPQFTPRLLKKLTQGLEVKTVQIDPVASRFPVPSKTEDAGAFIRFYDSLLDGFEACLK